MRLSRKKNTKMAMDGGKRKEEERRESKRETKRNKPGRGREKGGSFALFHMQQRDQVAKMETDDLLPLLLPSVPSLP